MALALEAIAPACKVGAETAATAGPVARLRGTVPTRHPCLADWPRAPLAGCPARQVAPTRVVSCPRIRTTPVVRTIRLAVNAVEKLAEAAAEERLRAAPSAASAAATIAAAAAAPLLRHARCVPAAASAAVMGRQTPTSGVDGDQGASKLALPPRAAMPRLFATSRGAGQASRGTDERRGGNEAAARAGATTAAARSGGGRRRAGRRTVASPEARSGGKDRENDAER